MKQATIETDKGTIVAELFEDDAPKTVENFEKLASDGFYDGIAFHRVIPGFVVQGGDPITKEKGADHPRAGSGGPGYTIPCETDGERQVHHTGALSMAHAGRNTGGSQFFIVLDEANARHLDRKHTVFGQVTEGLDVVQSLQKGDVMTSVRVEDAS
jgi:peptidyl-prolyl cis-trans isomerase B (cyclophilin B)